MSLFSFLPIFEPDLGALPEQKPHFGYEKQAQEQGFSFIVGIDEAGRGPLAGNVVAAAVILPEAFFLSGLNDSKKLTEKKREELYALLMSEHALSFCVASASPTEIDELNILAATHLAMKRAVEGLGKSAREWELGLCLIDGLRVKKFPYPQHPLVKGDSLSLSIATASILAKVTRDRQMQEAAERYPEYGFAQHKGYGTALHLEALKRYGPTPLHRRSFAPVAQYAH